jgi:hypothetical protein
VAAEDSWEVVFSDCDYPVSLAYFYSSMAWEAVSAFVELVGAGPVELVEVEFLRLQGGGVPVVLQG